MLRRILRFQRFLTAARTSRPGRQLAALAADAGYADQAHLTRESRELSGSTPAALLDREVERLTE
jgi:AraC-like DNA-binding protein